MQDESSNDEGGGGLFDTEAGRTTGRRRKREPATPLQRALGLLIESGDYQRALRRYRSSLKEKWRQMGSGIRRELGWDFEVPTGGTSMWLRLPDGTDADELAGAAAARGVLIESGSTFFLDVPAPRTHVRLGYAAIPVERIDPGLRRLAHVVAELRSPPAS